MIYISADNRYRLYVNGEYIISGPSSGDINHYRYETLDIAESLIWFFHKWIYSIPSLVCISSSETPLVSIMELNTQINWPTIQIA